MGKDSVITSLLHLSLLPSGHLSLNPGPSMMMWMIMTDEEEKIFSLSKIG